MVRLAVIVVEVVAGIKTLSEPPGMAAQDQLLALLKLFVASVDANVHSSAWTSGAERTSPINAQATTRKRPPHNLVSPLRTDVIGNEIICEIFTSS
jgi:hypothetical protein